MRRFGLVYISRKPVSNENEVFKRLSLKTLIYYGLTHFDEVVSQFLEFGIETMLYRGILIPREMCFNKYYSTFNENIYRMKKENLIGLRKGYSKDDYNKLKILYKRMKKAEKRLQSTTIKEKELKETLYLVCKDVYNGWYEKPILKQFIEENKIEIPDEFRFEIIPKKNIIDGHFIYPLVILLLDKNYMSIDEISNITGISKHTVRRVTYVLLRYNIVKKEGFQTYTLSDYSIHKDAYSKIKKRIDNLKKYIEAVELSKKGESVYKISKNLNIPMSTISEIKKLRRPKTIFNNKTLDFLREKGMITDEDITLFGKEGLVWWDFRSSN
jgi:DNA-binding transcriptional regulator GbsR (MarR family)